MPIARKALDTYYAALRNYQQQGVAHEQATRLAFSTLLDVAARAHAWTLVLEQKLANRKRPDGTLYDAFKIPRGYWEAKDSADDLDAEIQAKIKRGYPLTNIIFEDTQRAVLYQNGRPALEADLTDRAQLANLLEQFFAYTGEQIDEFNAAVAEFEARIPELARGLMERIEGERKANPKFVAAFGQFHELCKASIDPNIGADEIEEMLVQHLLTERLFRTVFANEEFTARNAIAVEIEKVVKALTSRAFNRREFFKSLDYFYRAIEQAAQTIDDFTQKQAFLNTVYERFFQGFSRQQADTHGIVYTPQAIVDFMCASVESVLQKEFGKTLSDKGVVILDPCTGTGNFVVNLLRRIGRRDLKRKYSQELFANEVMLLPYYIASLNIEHAYYELTGEYAPFEGICFADTLDMAQAAQLSMFGEANTERVRRQKEAPITVIIGNPPYNVGQKSENENAKNRRYDEIDRRIRETYAKDSKATLKNKLFDPYVKFFRWATDRLNGRDGIICFVSNNSFIDQIAFDGMRKHLTQDFTTIYHLDLRGNVRHNPKLSGTAYNVFGIQVGVGITLLVRHRSQSDSAPKKPARALRESAQTIAPNNLLFHRFPEDRRKAEKLQLLVERQSIESIEWQTLAPNAKHAWLTEGMQADFETFLPLGTKEAKAAKDAGIQTIFKTYSLGASTNRDDVVYDFDRQSLVARVEQFIEDYNAEVLRWSKSRQKQNIDDFVRYDKIKWSWHLKSAAKRGQYDDYEPAKIRDALYRPFCKQYLYYDGLLNDGYGLFGRIFPTIVSQQENSAICLTGLGSEKPFMVMLTGIIADLHLVGAGAGAQCFPFYVYDEDGSNRRENITDWALAQFREKYGPQMSKRDIFHYVYALLHHPGYRARYAENLKRELPRLPFVGAMHASPLQDIGARLAQLHLTYEQADEYPLHWIENKDAPFSWRVAKMKLTPDKTALVVNASLTLAGLPSECFEYRLGNRSALEWVIDQYQVSVDKRTGLTTDPNRADDPEYIARLIGRVVRVSVETVKAVRELQTIPL